MTPIMTIINEIKVALKLLKKEKKSKEVTKVTPNKDANFSL
jgi:hypothetical protein